MEWFAVLSSVFLNSFKWLTCLRDRYTTKSNDFVNAWKQVTYENTCVARKMKRTMALLAFVFL